MHDTYINVNNLKHMKKLIKYFEKEKDKGRKKALGRYQNLTEEEKEKKRQYHRERNKSLFEEQKKKLL